MCYFFTFCPTVQVDFVEVVFYFKQVFYLLYNKSVKPADE